MNWLRSSSSMKRQARFVSGDAKDIARAWIALACAAAVSWSQPTPPSPAVRAFGDNNFRIAVEDGNCVIRSANDRIVVPKDFVTDFASIPEPLWSTGLSHYGQYSRAAVVDGYLYWSQGCKRAQSEQNPTCCATTAVP
jgi:hypothetical protein